MPGTVGEPGNMAADQTGVTLGPQEVPLCGEDKAGLGSGGRPVEGLPREVTLTLHQGHP